MEVSDEVVERECPRALGLDLPQQERADRVAAHETVHQREDLVRVPDEFPLDRGQEVLARVDLRKDILDCDRGLKRHAIFAFLRDARA